MSKEYDNTNRGVLYINDKGDNDSRPDWKGSINVNGKEFWLSAWRKTTRDGDKMLSLSVQEKEPRREERRPAQNTRQPAKNTRDDNDGLDW